jgi:phosphatidylinositol 4-kinase type 2
LKSQLKESANNSKSSASLKDLNETPAVETITASEPQTSESTGTAATANPAPNNESLASSQDLNTKPMAFIKVAAIDNGLAFPFKHPDEWRACKKIIFK